MGYNLLYGEVPKIRSSRVPGSKISKSITSEEVEGAERAAREARSGWVRGEMWVIPSGKHTKNMEKSTIFNGKIHYFEWAIFNSYVCLPEGNLGFNGSQWAKNDWDLTMTYHDLDSKMLIQHDSATAMFGWTKVNGSFTSKKKIISQDGGCSTKHWFSQLNRPR